MVSGDRFMVRRHVRKTAAIKQVVLGLRGEILVAGGYRCGFCEKLLEASPVSDRANASLLQDGPAAGQG